MKRLLFILIPIISLSGCMVEEDHTSALDPIRQEDYQTRHYRPVYKDNSSWSIDELGKNITLKTGDKQIKVSTRYTSGQPVVIMRDNIYDTITHILPVWDPLYMVIRTDGYIMGYVQSSNRSVEVYTISNSDSATEQSHRIVFQCDTSRQQATIITPLKTIHYSIKPDEVSDHVFTVKKQTARRQYAVMNTLNSSESQTSLGKELESPFNTIGMMVFHTDDIPLPERTALAWYLTVTHTNCLPSPQS